MTLCFSAAQGLLAAKCRASFISPFVGRVDDIGWNDLGLVGDIVQLYDNYDLLVASVRSPLHVVEASSVGAHVATLPRRSALVVRPSVDGEGLGKRSSRQTKVNPSSDRLSKPTRSAERAPRS